MKWDARNVCTKLKANVVRGTESLGMQSSKGDGMKEKQKTFKNQIFTAKQPTLKYGRTEEQLGCRIT